MVARKLRLIVVLDTNVFIGHFLSHSKDSFNTRVFRLWLFEGQLQLVVSPEIIEEYLDAFDRKAHMTVTQLDRWRDRFEDDSHCTLVNLARRYSLSRDPDDDLFLATAHAGRAEFLVTNDRDLLDIPAAEQAKLPFAILTPQQFLEEFSDD